MKRSSECWKNDMGKIESFPQSQFQPQEQEQPLGEARETEKMEEAESASSEFAGAHGEDLERRLRSGSEQEGGAQGEQAPEVRKKSLIELAKEHPKAVRAVASIGIAAVHTWFDRPKEGKEALKVFADRARRYYQFGGKLEDAVLRDEWDALMGAEGQNRAAS